MADSYTDPVVTDRRTEPKGGIPKGTKVWLMVALTGFMLTVILIGQWRATPPAPKTTGPALTSVPESATESVRSLQSLTAEAVNRLLPADPRDTRDRLPEGRLPATPPVATSSASAPEDPIREERRRREYDSLFASNVVSSRRTGARQWSGVAAPDTRHDARTETPRPPTLDEVAASVVRASGGGPSYTHPAVNSQAQSPLLPGVTTDRPVNTPDRTGPITSAGPLHRVLEGTYIDAVLAMQLDGSSESPIKVQVTEPLYSFNRDHVLIPAGAWLVGTTKPVQSLNDGRLGATFHRLEMQDGSTRTLDDFKALNSGGDSGLKGHVDRHYLPMFGAAALVGVVNGIGQAVGNVGYGGSGSNRTVVVAGNVGTSSSQATSQVMNRFANRLPTITIPPGTLVKVYVTHDLELPAYDPPRAR